MPGMSRTPHTLYQCKSLRELKPMSKHGCVLVESAKGKGRRVLSVIVAQFASPFVFRSALPRRSIDINTLSKSRLGLPDAFGASSTSQDKKACYFVFV